MYKFKENKLFEKGYYWLPVLAGNRKVAQYNCFTSSLTRSSKSFTAIITVEIIYL